MVTQNYQSKKHFYPPAAIYKNIISPIQPQVFNLENSLFHCLATLVNGEKTFIEYNNYQLLKKGKYTLSSYSHLDFLHNWPYIIHVLRKTNTMYCRSKLPKMKLPMLCISLFMSRHIVILKYRNYLVRQ